METRTVQLNVQTNAATTQDEFKRLHQEIAKAEQEFEDLNNTLGETDAATVAAKQKVTDLRGAYTQLNQTATDLDGTFEQVYGQLQPLTTRMGEAEDRLYELALAGKQATQEYKDLMAATQNYLRTQMQVDLQVEAGAMPMAQKLTMAIGGVAGAFGVAEGAIALFGVESKAMQETLIRLNALLAITSGLVAIKEAIPIFEDLGNKGKAAFLKIKLAIGATGIGALIIAAGALVLLWDDIGRAISGASIEQEKLAKNAKKKVEADKTALTVYEKQWELLKAQGKTEKEIAKLQLGKLNTMIKNAEIQVATAKKTRDAEVQSSKWWAKFWQGMWDASAGFLKGLFGGLDAIGQVLGEDFGLTKWLDETGKGFVKFFADPEAVKAEQDKIVAESEVYLLDLKIKYKEAENTISEVIKKEGDKRVEITDKTQKDKLDLTRQNRDKEIELMEDGIEKEREIIKEKYKREKEDLEANSKDKIVDKEQYAAAEKLIQENLDKELSDLDNKYSKEARDRRIENEEWFKNYEKQQAEERLQAEIKRTEEEEAARQRRDENRIQARFAMLTDEQLEEYNSKKEFNHSLAELDRLKNEGAFKTEEEYQKAVDILQDKYNKKELARKIELRQKTLELAGSAFSALSELAGSFNTKNEKDARKQFQVQKAFNLAAAITNTGMAVTGALTAGGNPIKLATGMQFVEAGIAATVGAANIIKIANSRFGGGAGGGGNTDVPNPAAGGGMTAQFNTIGTSGINQLATLQQQPVQAYVVSGEVTSAQSLDRNRVQNATL